MVKKRDDSVKKINEFIDLEFGHEKTKRYGGCEDLTVGQLANASGPLKYNIIVKNFYNKLDAVANNMIESYTYEANKIQIIPKDPKSYRKMLLDELGVTEEQLVKMFVEHIETS